MIIPGVVLDVSEVHMPRTIGEMIYRNLGSTGLQGSAIGARRLAPQFETRR